MHMHHHDTVRKLRADQTTHYNCCQAVLVTFAKEMGLSPKQAFDLGAHFGSGMRHGSTCGALSAGLMVLGALGFDDKMAAELLRDFRENHGATDCATLLKASHERGESRKQHCNDLVFDVVDFLANLVMVPD